MTAPGDPIILTVARLDARERYKGVDHLIEAMPAVRLVVPETRLRIIGTGSDLPRLQEMATRLGAADAVDFAGFVNDDGLSAPIASAPVCPAKQRRGIRKSFP